MVNLGIIDRDKMNEIYNISDVLFMPSYMELFPMTILEMCNLGKPILVRNLELYRPILFAKYCYGDNVNEFSEQLLKLKNDVTYYHTQSENSKFISHFYNKDVLKTTWKDYYYRIFDNWNSKRKAKNIK